jgi:hypothetical protein
MAGFIGHRQVPVLNSSALAILFTPSVRAAVSVHRKILSSYAPSYAISPTIRPNSERPKIIHPVHESPSNLPASRLRCRSSKNPCANMSGRFAASNPPKQTAPNTSTKGNIVKLFSTHAKFFPAFGLTIHITGSYAVILWRRGWESNPRMKVLQTSPFPLGYRASDAQYSERLAGFQHAGACCGANRPAFSRRLLPRRGSR